MGLAFLPETHEYLDRATGQILPSITAMLQRAGLVDDRWFTEASRERGSAVHQWCLDYDLGALRPELMPPSYAPYCAAYRDALTVLTPTWEHCEVPMAHPDGWAGRPDRVGTMHGKPTVLEIKTGGYAPEHRVQTALQALLVGHNEGATL